MRLRSILATSVFVAGLAIGQSALAQTTVTFWQFFTRDADVAAWHDAIAKFETANPDIKINMEIVPWSEQQQRFVTALPTGGLPDVSMLGNNVVAQFQATGSLAPLDDYVAAYDKETRHQDRRRDLAGRQGLLHPRRQVVGLADHCRDARALLSQGPVQGSRPRSRQAAADLGGIRHRRRRADQGRQGQVYGIALPMSLDYNTVQNFMSTYLGYGARMIGEDGKCGFDTPEFKAALDIYTRVYKDGGTHPDAPTMDGDTFRSGFRDGNYAMILQNASL